MKKMIISIALAILIDGTSYGMQIPEAYVRLKQRQGEMSVQPPSQARSATSIDADNILPNINYPHKEELKQAIKNFQIRAELKIPFNKALFGLTSNLGQLKRFQDGIMTRYYAYLQDGRFQDEGPHEDKIMEIERLMNTAKELIFSLLEIVDFTPPVFEAKITMQNLNPLQKQAVFMLLGCVTDDTFSEFNTFDSPYRLSFTNIFRELNNSGTVRDTNICFLIHKMNSAY